MCHREALKYKACMNVLVKVLCSEVIPGSILPEKFSVVSVLFYFCLRDDKFALGKLCLSGR